MTILAALLLSSIIEWEFPRTASCHEGMAFADGVTGVLVWGGGDELRLTVGRADLWDHRGGYKWTEAQSYTNIVDAIHHDHARLKELFKKEVPKGEPKNPYMLPLGRVVVKIPGAVLKHGELDTATGMGYISFGDKVVELAMGKESRTFAMRFPKGTEFSVTTIPAYEFPVSGAAFREVGITAPRKFASAARGGFMQTLPADPAVSLVWLKNGPELLVATARGEVEAQPRGGYAKVRDESADYWTAFWRDSARVSVPDPVIQRIFDYGMYRFGAMTDPDGVPAGLQGEWLEDDRLVPWHGDYHFNINVQECYAPAYRSGHVENLRPLFKMVKGWWPRLQDNARKLAGVEGGFVLPHSVDDRGVCIGGFWTGTIDHGSAAWTAAMMFRYVKYAQDLEFLKSDAYPFMKGAMKVYRAMMEEYQGRLSLPIGPSPEWGGSNVEVAVGRDPSFQLAAAHRLARDLIAAAAMLGERPDPMWLEVERRLPRYSKCSGGICLFENRPFSATHRHHSHMAGLFPFDVIDVEGADRKDVQATYHTWVKNGTGMWTGWCVPWASVLNTHVGNANAAMAMLHNWEAYFCNPGHGSLHNSYANGFTAITSTPDKQVMQMDGQCAAAAAVMEMMVHEVNGKERYFAGCPETWQRVSFENILTSSGRRVSGVRENGKVTIR